MHLVHVEFQTYSRINQPIDTKPTGISKQANAYSILIFSKRIPLFNRKENVYNVSPFLDNIDRRFTYVG